MGITPSSDLFDLIKSLTAPEKGYIIRHAFQATDKKASIIKTMFEFIDNCTIYNEKGMINLVFKKNTKMAAVYKKLLHEKTLKYLSNYHTENSLKASLFKKLHMAEILYNKALYKQCNSLLNKIEAEAKKYELFTILIEAGELRGLFMAWGASSEKERVALVEKKFNQEKIYIENLDLNLRYWKTNVDYFFYLEKNPHEQNQEDIRKNEALIWNNPLLNSEEYLNTYRAKIQYNNILANYYMRKRNPQLLYTHYKNNYSFLLKKSLTQIYSGSYITALTGLIQACIMLNKFDEGLTYVNELFVFDTQGIVALEKRKSFFATVKKIELITKAGKAKEKLVEIEFELKKLIDNERDLNVYLKSSIYFTVSLMYFSIDNYQKAEEWLIKIFDLPSIKKQKETFLFSKLFYLIVLFERKKYELIPSVIRSIYSFKHKKCFLEKELISFFTKQLKIIDTKELKQGFILLQKIVVLVIDNPLENQFIEYFDLITWVESKIQNRPMIEILKEKVVRNK